MHRHYCSVARLDVFEEFCRKLSTVFNFVSSNPDEELSERAESYENLMEELEAICDEEDAQQENINARDIFETDSETDTLLDAAELSNSDPDYEPDQYDISD